MSTTKRLVFLLVALLIAVPLIATALISDDSEDDGSRPAAAVAPTGTGAPTTTASPKPAPPKPAAPKPPLLKAGNERTLTVTKGDTVKFRVVHPTAEEVHVHGYDLTYDLEPGVTKTVSFKATIDGQFEIELEQSATPLAKLVVNPN